MIELSISEPCRAEAVVMDYDVAVDAIQRQLIG